MRKGSDCDYDKRNISVVMLTQIFSSFESSHDGDFWSDDFYLIARNPWLGSFLVSSNIRSRKSSSRISHQREIYTPCTGAAGKNLYIFFNLTKWGIGSYFHQMWVKWQKLIISIEIITQNVSCLIQLWTLFQIWLSGGNMSTQRTR